MSVKTLSTYNVRLRRVICALSKTKIKLFCAGFQILKKCFNFLRITLAGIGSKHENILLRYFCTRYH